MRITKKIGMMVLCALLAIPSVFALTGCGNKGGKNDYSVWLYTGQDTTYYTSYSDNPVLKYLLKDAWNDKNLSFQFTVPPAGTAQDNFTAILKDKKNLPTLMQNSVADPAPNMYNNGFILDISDEVKEYMPNYYSLIQSNEALKSMSVYNIGGKERILSLNVLNEGYPYIDFGAICYRRDWIADYGKNPSTNVPFTGTYTDANDVDSYVDDIVFPSWYDATKKAKALAIDPNWEGTEPFYISDWEWMFEIFTSAQTDLGITDGYSTSMYFPGYTWSDGLSACFGEGGLIWYNDTQGQVQFGGTSNSTRAYFTCLNNWYNEGWLDETFNERTSDSHYGIDSKSVRSGKVGMWTGVKGDLGGRIDSKDYKAGDYTEGIFVAGCAWPVNDVYGDDSCKYIAPRVTNVSDSLVGTGFFVMKGAEKKDLASLFTMLDHLYTDEGAALRTLGLSKEQLEEEGTDKSFYNSHNLSDGAYSVTSEGKYVVNNTISTDSGSLSIAASLNKFPGIQLVDSIDNRYAETLENSLKSWVKYKNVGRVFGTTAMNNMSSSDSDAIQDALTKVLNLMERDAVKYIKGTDGKDITSDSSWRSWCNAINKFDVDKTSAIWQKYVDLYPVA